MGTRSVWFKGRFIEWQVLLCLLSMDVSADTFSGESGVEWDTNIHRTETVNGLRGALPIRQMALLRVGLRGGGVRKVRGLNVEWDGYGGAKLFSGEEGQRENVGIVSLSSQILKNLKDGDSLLGLSLSHYDAFGFDPFSVGLAFSGRNFRTSRVGVLGTRNIGEKSRITVRADGTRFEFKSNSDFDWNGFTLGSDLKTRLWNKTIEHNDVKSSASIRSLIHI